jgi:hypothetical protein
MLLLPHGTICTSRLRGHVVVAIVLFVPAMKILTVALFVLLHYYCSFGKSTARYATFMTVGVIGAELFTNSLTDSLWEANNSGKTYAQVDWSKFDPADDDDDDDDDGDDDDDDDE